MAAAPSWDVRRETARRTPAHSSRTTDSPRPATDFPCGDSPRLVLPDTPPRERPPGGACACNPFALSLSKGEPSRQEIEPDDPSRPQSECRPCGPAFLHRPPARHDKDSLRPGTDKSLDHLAETRISKSDVHSMRSRFSRLCRAQRSWMFPGKRDVPPREKGKT